MSKQVALIILDGWGYREDSKDNAIAQANTPNFDALWEKYPHSLLHAGEEHVGLPKGQIGNSEVGHMTIGAGAIIDSDLVRIAKAITDESFHDNLALQKMFAHVDKNSGVVHVVGLIGTGGVHSHSDHLHAFLRAAKKAKQTKVYLHLFTDGRDAPPHAAREAIKELQKVIAEVGVGEIVSVSGRYYAMDRDKNWNRLEKFSDILYGHSNTEEISDIESEMNRQQAEGKTDELIIPFKVKNVPLQKGDGIFMFNFRADRVRQLAQKLCERKEELDLSITTMTEYQECLDVDVVFPPKVVETTIAQEVAKAGMCQVHIAETEKFPHATYFLNGGKEDCCENEEHVVLESRKDVYTHDEAPEMRAEAIADEAIARIKNGVEFIFINFANADMVGHTANMPAVIKAVETVDCELGRVIEALNEMGGVAIVTADHGNAEENVNHATGEKHTSHTLNPVPCIMTKKDQVLHDGSLQDLAPTVLSLLSIPQSKAMTGVSLIGEKK